MMKTDRQNIRFSFCSCNVTKYWVLDDISAAHNQRTRIHEQRTMLYFYKYFSYVVFSLLISLSFSLRPLFHSFCTHRLQNESSFFFCHCILFQYCFHTVWSKHTHVHISCVYSIDKTQFTFMMEYYVYTVHSTYTTLLTVNTQRNCTKLYETVRKMNDRLIIHLTVVVAAVIFSLMEHFKGFQKSKPCIFNAMN